MTMTPEQRRARAQRLNEFLNDEIISTVFSRLERKYYEEFKQAKNAEERARTQGKANVLDDLTLEFKVVLDDGEVAMHEIAAELKKTEQQKRT